MSTSQTHQEVFGSGPEKQQQRPTPPDWDQVDWRQLKKGEKIKKGDWVDIAPDGWRDDALWEQTTRAGETAPDPSFVSHRVYRRVIK